MGQFRLRKKYRKKDFDASVADKPTDESSLSISQSEDKGGMNRFRPKSFVMQPRDQVKANYIKPLGWPSRSGYDYQEEGEKVGTSESRHGVR